MLIGTLKKSMKKFSEEKRTGVGYDMTACLLFSAFSIEAKINFVGWKVLEKGWPERANLREKIDLLNEILGLDLNWGTKPLQTLAKLKKFRDTIAHGKPEIVDETKVVKVEPEVWDALKGQWEAVINENFVADCRNAEKELWDLMLEKADIPEHQTLTHGGHSLAFIREA
ncbi:hypothetical protein ACXYMO_17515 [Arenibacterium sp. CAU 1754]